MTQKVLPEYGIGAVSGTTAIFGSVWRDDYFLLLLYTALVFSPREVVENLKRSGAYIPGIRPDNKLSVTSRSCIKPTDLYWRDVYDGYLFNANGRPVIVWCTVSTRWYVFTDYGGCGNGLHLATKRI